MSLQRATSQGSSNVVVNNNGVYDTSILPVLFSPFSFLYVNFVLESRLKRVQCRLGTIYYGKYSTKTDRFPVNNILNWVRNYRVTIPYELTCDIKWTCRNSPEVKSDVTLITPPLHPAPPPPKKNHIHRLFWLARVSLTLPGGADPGVVLGLDLLPTHGPGVQQNATGLQHAVRHFHPGG